MTDSQPPLGRGEGRAAGTTRNWWVSDREPIRAPRGLDFAVAALPPMKHSALVALFATPQPDLDDATPLQWLSDDGSPALAVLALLTPAQLVTRVRDLLGAKLTAYIAAAGDTATVRDWADGTSQPDDDQLFRLAVAACAAGLLHQRDTTAVVQAWFQGQNAELGDTSPARALREDRLGLAGIPVLVAARRAAGLPL